MELRKINVPKDARYVCLLVRSSAYRKGHPTWNRPERNAELSTYMQACRYLAKQGYYVLRMGKEVDDTFEDSDPRIIDYAKSPIRSDFMDIYLSAHCYFFITTGSGLDSVAEIFRRPLLYTNCIVISYAATWYPHYLFIPKMAAEKENNRLLSFKENVQYLCDGATHAGIPFNIFELARYLNQTQLTLIDNTESELLDVVMEMDSRLNESWQDTLEQIERQQEFWDIFPKDFKIMPSLPLHGEINTKLGSAFLTKYQHLLTSPN